jgi:hypothetical protein
MCARIMPAQETTIPPMIIKTIQGLVKIKTALQGLQICKVSYFGSPQCSLTAGGGATWISVVVPSLVVCITAMCSAPSCGIRIFPVQLPIH